MSSQEKNILTIEEREENLNPRQIRSKGFTPVTIYEKSKSSISGQVKTKDFSIAKSSKFVQTLEVNFKKENFLVVIKDIQKNPIKNQILNIQLHKVNKDQIVTLSVPLVFKNTSPLVQAGGSMFINKSTVNLFCVAGKIPSCVEFDLSSMKDNFRIACYSDLVLPEGCKLNCPASEIMVKISIPQEASSATAEK